MNITKSSHVETLHSFNCCLRRVMPKTYQLLCHGFDSDSDTDTDKVQGCILTNTASNHAFTVII